MVVGISDNHSRSCIIFSNIFVNILIWAMPPFLNSPIKTFIHTRSTISSFVQMLNHSNIFENQHTWQYSPSINTIHSGSHHRKFSPNNFFEHRKWLKNIRKTNVKIEIENAVANEIFYNYVRRIHFFKYIICFTELWTRENQNGTN